MGQQEQHEKQDVARLRECIRALVRRFALAERADVECCGVTVAQAATLEALYRHREAVRLGDLGRLLGISASTLTRNLTRLEERGLVERAADPNDRRAAQVTLTSAGLQSAAAVERYEEEFAASILANLPSGRTAAVLQALQELLAAIRTATERCCPGAFDHLMADGPWGQQQKLSGDPEPNEAKETSEETVRGGQHGCCKPTA